MDHSNPQVDLNDADMRELEEVIIEFLSKYEALYEKRIHKLVFYGEILTAQHYGERLTNSDFMPYYHGPYSEAVSEAVEDMEAEGRISINPRRKGEQYMTSEDGGEISPKKKAWIDKIHEDTKGMRTSELVDFAKDTWLWQNFERGEDIDFAEYIDEVTPPVQTHYELSESEGSRASDSRVDELLL